MTLYEHLMSDCVIIEQTRTADGEGGFTTVPTEGEIFSAAIVLSSSTLAKIAEKQGVSSVYTVTTYRDTKLPFHTIIKRKSDNRYFRVTSEPNEQETPNTTALDIAQYSAEKWEMNT